MRVKVKQQGFVLISVLLITTIATALAISTVGENRLQERIAGNQVKEINARSIAEKGIFESYSSIEVQQSESASLADIIEVLNGKIIGNNQIGSYELNVGIGSLPTTLIITSKGEYHGAVAYLKAEIEVLTGIVEGAPGGAVVACEGVSLTAGGLIDSFDSRDGVYSSSNAKENADVVTINGDVNISGGTNLKGDLTVNGNVTQSGSTTIGGNLAASGDVTLAQAAVNGNINANGNVEIAGGQVGLGNDLASGNVDVGGYFDISGNGTSTGALNYAGELKKPWETYDIGDFSDSVNEGQPTSAAMAANKCNEKDIATALPSVNGSQINTNMKTGHGGALAELEFNEMNAQVFNQTDTSKPHVNVSPSDLTSSLWEGDKPVYVFDDFNMNNTMITIVGDVTIMVKGDLSTSGGGTGFRFNDNDTNSSLTILSEGQVAIGSSTKIFENATIDSVNKKVPLTVYSSFESSGSNTNENAVYLDGAANMYAKVYAPLGNIEYAAGGAMMGSLEGKNVSVSGAGAIHYDEALQYVGEPISSGDNSVKFASLYYHYPD